MSGRGAELARAGALAVAVTGIDQLSKAIARGAVAPGERIDLIAGTGIVRVANRGIAFGLLDHAGTALLVAVAVVFTVVLAAVLVGSGRRGLWLPVGLLVGGAVGNLIDRIREGFVTDFLDLPAWPAFNLADVAITAGVLILLAAFLLDERRGAVGEGGRGAASEP